MGKEKIDLIRGMSRAADRDRKAIKGKHIESPDLSKMVRVETVRGYVFKNVE